MFGMYMKPVKMLKETPLTGSITNRYPAPYFRMDADKNCFVARNKHPVEEERLLMYEQFQALKIILKIYWKDWEWQQVFYDDDGSKASRIFAVLKNVNIFNRECWSLLFHFKRR